MEPQTINELLKWLQSNCYSDSYAIGETKIYEGYGLDFNGSAYVWYYTERGQRQDVHYFQTEKEAVAHAFSVIKADPYANRHMIGFVKSESEHHELMKELKRRGITYYNDILFYSNQSPRDRYRVFVFGCDVQKVGDLEHRYGYRNKF